ncbi:hypothetical protein IGK74_002379 [Enterococcus sp. AZ150]|uniref:terminase large subunit n=1 Tax=Enterococcus sp. AZ150 TaxID=2774866 RepID=UPI003F234094
MDDATRYAESVLNGDILACESVKQACKRHLRDLEEQTEYFWDYSYASKVIEFMEMLPDPKSGKTFPLASFQKFIIGSIYGWRRSDNKELRRFKKVVVSVARKNGKSLLISGLILYEFLFGKNPAMSRQLFTAANDKFQAKIVFDMVAKQLEALRSKYPEIRKVTKKVREELKNLKDYSYLRPLSRETGGLDGYEMYCVVVDEYAAAKTDEIMGLVQSSQLQLESPLTFIISTAGFNLNGPFYATEWPYAKKVASGDIKNEKYFSYLAEQESLEEIEDENTWIKSNPILEVKALQKQVYDFLREEKREAQEKGEFVKVLVKNFNMWTQSSEEAYLSTEHWKKAAIEKPDISGHKVWVGVDVGRTSDLFSISWTVQMDDYFYVDSFSFVATKYGLATKEKRDGVNYTYLEQKGLCKITELESGVIDYDDVYEWLERFIYENDLDLQSISYDPYQYGHILTMIEKNHPDWLQAEVKQSTMVLNAPTKQLRDDVINLKVRHSDNDLLTMAVNNAVTKTDNNGMRIDKNKNSNKIDPLDALLDAYAMCYTEFQGGSFWTDDMILSEDFGF